MMVALNGQLMNADAWRTGVGSAADVLEMVWSSMNRNTGRTEPWLREGSLGKMKGKSAEAVLREMMARIKHLNK